MPKNKVVLLEVTIAHVTTQLQISNPFLTSFPLGQAVLCLLINIRVHKCLCTEVTSFLQRLHLL